MVSLTRWPLHIYANGPLIPVLAKSPAGHGHENVAQVLADAQLFIGGVAGIKELDFDSAPLSRRGFRLGRDVPG